MIGSVRSGDEREWFRRVRRVRRGSVRHSRSWQRYRARCSRAGVKARVPLRGE
jgi:hypothetical protein